MSKFSTDLDHVIPVKLWFVMVTMHVNII